MELQYLPQASPLWNLRYQTYSYSRRISCPNYIYTNRMIDVYPKHIICHHRQERSLLRFRICGAKRENFTRDLETTTIPDIPKKKGTVAGAVALIIGTSIGSGILALPKKTYQAGLVPSSISLVFCWAFLLIEALVLVEINVGLLKRKDQTTVDNEEDELAVISIRTMAQETLGEWGGSLATLTYIFLGYTSVIAYCSKSGEILYHLINLPQSISTLIFTAFFTVLVSVGGTRATDQVNQWLTAFMIGLLIVIEVLAILLGGWSGFEGTGDWGRVPATFPVMIFSLVYHDLAPFLCSYLEGDLQRIRVSILLGSIVPLLALLVWNAIALGLSASPDQFSDPVDVLMRVNWSGFPAMVEAFSLLAVGTSLIGTLLGFSQFFKEQLYNNNTFKLEKSEEVLGIEQWWRRNKVNTAAMTMAIAPSLLISTTVPDSFSAATDFAGGYCMTILYGILPPAMAWAIYNRERDNLAISKVGPVIVGIGLFSCGIVLEQLMQDLSIFRFQF